MSGRDGTDSRLSRTKFGFRAAAARHDGLCLRDYQARELGRFLREEYPGETARAAAADLREPLQTVRNWLEGTSFPNGFKLLKLQHRFGLRLLARLDPDPEPTLALAIEGARRAALQAEFARIAALLDLGATAGGAARA